MAGKFRAWANNLSADVKRDIAETASREGERLRDDVWQKVIKEGWMGQQTPYETQGSVHGSSHDAAPHEGTVWDQEAKQDFYENPNWETTKEAAHGAAQMDTLGHTPEQATIWDTEKANAEALQGGDAPDFYGMDVDETKRGTVWDNEQEHGVEAPDLEPD